MRSDFTTALLYSAGAAAMVASFVGFPGDNVPGARGSHVWDLLWSIDHWAAALADGRNPWTTAALNYPEGGRVWIRDPLGATLVAPVVWAFGPSVGVSVLIGVQLAFSGWVTHRFAAEFLAWRRGSGRGGWGPLVAGVAMLTAPVLVAHIHNGATEALSVGWLVLSIWMGWRAASGPSPRRLAVAAFALAGAFVASLYAGLVAGCFLAAIAVVGTGRLDAPWSVGRWAPLLAGSLLCASLAIGVSAVVHAPDAVDAHPSVGEVQQITRTYGAADPATYIIPGEHRSPDFRTFSPHERSFVHGHYLGWVLMGLSGWALVRRRRNTGFLVGGGLACGLLSLGPVLVRNARPLIIGDDRAIPLPFYALESLRGFEDLTMPWWFSIGPAFALAMLAAVAVDQRGKRMALAVIAAVVLEASWVAPSAELRASVDARPPASLLALAEAPPGAVINYPLKQGRPYLFEQTIHGKPVAGTMKSVGNRQAMQLWRRIRAESLEDPDSFHRAVSSTAERLGIRYLVIHTDPDAEPDVYSKAVNELERLFDVPEWGRGHVRVVPLW